MTFETFTATKSFQSRRCTWCPSADRPTATYILRAVLRGHTWRSHSYGVCTVHFERAVAEMKHNSGATRIAVLKPDTGRVTHR